MINPPKKLIGSYIKTAVRRKQFLWLTKKPQWGFFSKHNVEIHLRTVKSCMMTDSMLKYHYTTLFILFMYMYIYNVDTCIFFMFGVHEGACERYESHNIRCLYNMPK